MSKRRHRPVCRDQEWQNVEARGAFIANQTSTWADDVFDVFVHLWIGPVTCVYKGLTDPDKFYAASPYTFLIASLLILIFGPGKFCVDSLLARRFQAESKERQV